MCCCLPTLRQFFRHIAPNWIGETKGSTADSGDKFKVYAMRTFGSGPARPRRKSQMDTLMRTQGTRIDDADDYDYHKNTNANSMDANMVGREWENDARFGRVTDIRGGRDDQSLEGGDGAFKGDFESDKEILRSRTVKVEVSY